METITDNDLKMFQERSKTEFASRCDTGGIAWDSVIWDLCNEVRKLRSVSKERGDAGDCAKLREALKAIVGLCAGLMPTWDGAIGRIKDMAEAALSAPPRNCDKYPHDEALRIWSADPENPMNGCFDVWLFAPATEQEGENNG